MTANSDPRSGRLCRRIGQLNEGGSARRCRAVHRAARVMLVWGAVLSGGPLAAGATDPPTAPVPDAVAEIPSLVAALGAPEFRDREAATERLTELGRPAIDAVVQAGTGRDLEVGLRAVQILGALYQSSDLELIDAAGYGLERLAEEAPDAVAQQALVMLDRNRFTVRQKRAVEAIRRFGGQVNLETERPALFDGRPIRPPGGWARFVAIGREWTGGDDGLKFVAQLDTLEVLYLVAGHPLSSEAVANLEQQLPELKVQPRGAAFLGVATQQDALGCVISQIRPGTAAEQAGLEQGDVVLEIDRQAVRTPEDLIEIIGGCEPGRTVELTILRGEPLQKFVLLDLLHERDEFAPLLAIALMQQMHRRVPVTLGDWKIDSSTPGR